MGFVFLLCMTKRLIRVILAYPDDYTVIISKELKNYKKHLSYQNCFAPIEDKPIMLPNKHNPNPEFLAYHIEHIFVKHN